MFRALFGIARSWQKGQQYARDAQLKEQRTITEQARQQQIMADVELKQARTRLLNALADKRGETSGLLMYGCNNCSIFGVDEGMSNCSECGGRYTYEHIDLWG